MADIVYKFQEMESAAVKVDGYAERYQKAADTLRDTVISNIASWEGDSKDKFVTLLEGAIYKYIHEDIPKLVGVIASEIRSSAENMSKADADLAANIPQSLG